ncbi:hypothetical protein CEXT_777431 [Caerostris extrusa]|uniref:Uncharacterized protein n=1 Tax=Caerostris extrusa TaxID=172846 RepID=A0AAV4PS85_CAEEX|nr:hypothetical protein CEXT_777431 [Caerostris extrusa]
MVYVRGMTLVNEKKKKKKKKGNHARDHKRRGNNFAGKQRSGFLSFVFWDDEIGNRRAGWRKSDDTCERFQQVMREDDTLRSTVCSSYLSSTSEYAK